MQDDWNTRAQAVLVCGFIALLAYIGKKILEAL